MQWEARQRELAIIAFVGGHDGIVRRTMLSCARHVILRCTPPTHWPEGTPEFSSRLLCRSTPPLPTSPRGTEASPERLVHRAMESTIQNLRPTPRHLSKTLSTSSRRCAATRIPMTRTRTNSCTASPFSTLSWRISAPILRIRQLTNPRY